MDEVDLVVLVDRKELKPITHLPYYPITLKSPSLFIEQRALYDYSGGDLFSRRVAPRVSSARVGFTTVFGMGTGGTPLL